MATHTEYSGRDNLEVMALARNYNRFLVDQVLAVSRPQQLVVDFGAGAGTFSRPVAQAGRHVVCVETDPTLCRALQEAGHPVAQDLEHLQDASVDCLYSLNVLEHIDNDEAVLRAWARKHRRPSSRKTTRAGKRSPRRSRSSWSRSDRSDRACGRARFSDWPCS